MIDLIGQMVMVGYHGQELEDNLRRLILDNGVGGIILFTRNIESLSQISDVISHMQELSRERNPELPLFISIDQEGGRVARLPPPFRKYPTYRELARNGPEFVYSEMLALSGDLKEIGVNMNMAPVLDVDTNPKNPIIGDRSFGPDPYLVGKLGAIVMEAFNKNKIIPVGKHFPGHGDTTVDSHVDLPVVKKSLKQLEEIELIPFGIAVEKGLQAIMTAHIFFPEIDPKYPATVSPLILSGILRKKLKFDGVIISDDIEMKGISRWAGVDEIVANGINSELDIFLCCHTFELQKSILKKIKDLFLTGGDMEGKIINSINRISTLKRGLLKQ